MATHHATMDRIAHPDTPGHRSLRHGRWSAPGQTYLITTTTAWRHRRLGHWETGSAVARIVGDNTIWRQHTNHAWVLMPDHAHFLTTLGVDETLAQLMARVKSVTSRAAHRIDPGAKTTFWQRSFHDHALRCEDHLAIAARYIIANPVRANLVDEVWQWPFWDSQWLPVQGGDDLYIP